MNPGDPMETISSKVLNEIKQTLIEDESSYQVNHGESTFSSLWTHSVRVARIAHYLAINEEEDSTAALLAGLLHDAGKFVGGVYHRNDVAEEELAVKAAERILRGTIHEPLLLKISDAILSLYRDDVDPAGVGALLYDSDRLDKLGHMGIAQFFAKNALRGKFLDNDMMKRFSVEMTYAHHAPLTLKTKTGKDLATVRSARVRSFYNALIDEWEEMELGFFSIRNFDIEGIMLVLVMPDSCSCGARLDVSTDIKDSVKCHSAVVQYKCPRCNEETGFSFCLPNLPQLLARSSTSK